MSEYRVVDVDEWEVLDVEPMGSKPGKLWLESPTDQSRWLFKPVTVQREAPLGDPVELRVRNYALSIRRADALGIEVE